MKKLFLILFVVFATNAMGQLNQNAQLLKSNYNAYYQVIKGYSALGFEGKQLEMQINRQCDAFFEVYFMNITDKAKIYKALEFASYKKHIDLTWIKSITRLEAIEDFLRLNADWVKMRDYLRNNSNSIVCKR